MIRVYPAVNKTNKKCFMRSLKKAEAISAVVDIDIADGKFIRHKTVGISAIPKTSSHRYNVHYMGLNPKRAIARLPENVWQFQFHYEACKGIEIAMVIQACKDKGVKPVLAICPDTKVSEIKELVPQVFGVHLLTVYPGKSNQEMLTWVLRKVRYLRKIKEKVRIGIDGGVGMDTAKMISLYPINYVSSTSAVLGVDDPADAYKKLKKKLNS